MCMYMLCPKLFKCYTIYKYLKNYDKQTNKNWFLQNAFTWRSKISCDLQDQEAKEDDIVDINQTSAEELDDDSSDDDF